jgi:hypothetical protein
VVLAALPSLLQVAEQGTHDELVANKGLYAQLVARQLTSSSSPCLKGLAGSSSAVSLVSGAEDTPKSSQEDYSGAAVGSTTTMAGSAVGVPSSWGLRSGSGSSSSMEGARAVGTESSSTKTGNREQQQQQQQTGQPHKQSS